MEAATTLSERVVYSGRVFDVVVERVRLPHGHVTDLELVRHRGSVVLIPVAEDGRLLLVRQYRHAARRFLWELPAGTLEIGEAPEAAARRECQEELGLVPRHVEALQTFYPTPGFCTEAMAFFKVTDLNAPGPEDAQAVKDEDEAIEVAAFSVDDIRRMVRDGEIADLKTVAGLTVMTI